MGAVKHAYVVSLLVEWGRQERGEIRSSLGYAMPKYGERIGAAFSIDNSPMINPEVAKVVQMLNLLPVEHYAAIRLRYRDQSDVAKILLALNITRDRYYDLVASGCAMLDRWLRVDRATNGQLTRQTLEVSRQVAHGGDATTMTV